MSSYLEQKIAIDTYANYLREGYVNWIMREIDDYSRLLSQLNQAGAMSEVVENLFHYSFRPLKEKLEEIGTKARHHNAPALDYISEALDKLAKENI